MRSLFKILFLLFLAMPVFAASHSPAGEWKVFYEDTQIPGGKVKITVDKNGTLNGYVTEIYPKANETIPSTCVGCPGSFKNLPLHNLRVLWDLRPQGTEWTDGHGISLERKLIYKATVWLSETGDILFVRGRVGIFSKTQQWQRLTSG
jgi:uncharacterized protein (DUF2147 family)